MIERVNVIADLSIEPDGPLTGNAHDCTTQRDARKDAAPDVAWRQYGVLHDSSTGCCMTAVPGTA